MKRMVCLMLALVLAMSLAACGSSAKAPKTGVEDGTDEYRTSTISDSV